MFSLIGRLNRLNRLNRLLKAILHFLCIVVKNICCWWFRSYRFFLTHGVFRYKYVDMKPLAKFAIFFQLVFLDSYMGDKGQRFLFNSLMMKNPQLRVDLV